MYDRNSGADVVPEAPTPQDVDLGAGDSFDAKVDLLATFPPDGEYTAQVRLKRDAALVDIDIVGGKVAAPGLFAHLTQTVPSAYPPNLKFDGEPTFQGDDLYWRAQNVGPGPLPVSSPMGLYEIHDRDTDAEIVTLREAKVSQALGPGDSEGYSIPLDRLTPNDGKYTLLLWVGSDGRFFTTTSSGERWSRSSDSVVGLRGRELRSRAASSPGRRRRSGTPRFRLRPAWRPAV